MARKLRRKASRDRGIQRIQELSEKVSQYKEKHRMKGPIKVDNLDKRPRLRKLLEELIGLMVAPPGQKRVFCTRRWHHGAHRHLYAQDYGLRCWSFLVPRT